MKPRKGCSSRVYLDAIKGDFQIYIYKKSAKYILILVAKKVCQSFFFVGLSRLDGTLLAGCAPEALLPVVQTACQRMHHLEGILRDLQELQDQCQASGTDYISVASGGPVVSGVMAAFGWRA